ncbi:MAG: germination protein YpeB, partial [Candidatus Rokubacteria bacterium]|nr:germination protein YpeB [Candidatus Rokubacteria bacterium]
FHIDKLQTELGNTLTASSTSHDVYRRGLANVWRLTSQAQSEINQLPLTLMPFNHTEQFLANLANFSYRAAVRDMTKQPLTEQEMTTLSQLYTHAQDIRDQLRNTQGKVIANNLRWMDVETALAYVVWEVNRRAVGGAEGYLLVHGAAAARGGGAVVVVAASGGGKSTFVHALTRAGWGYLTDEAVAVDLSSGLVVPYPKPIALAGEGGRERLVAPGELVAGVAPPSPPRLVLVPERREGVPVSFEPVGRAAALVHLAEHSFNFRRAGCAAFDAAAAVVRGSECLRVRYAEADDAVAALGRDPSVWGGPA